MKYVREISDNFSTARRDIEVMLIACRKKNNLSKMIQNSTRFLL